VSPFEARNLRFTYRGAPVPALDGVSFEVEPGEFVVIMGQGGAGKSTLCRCLNGLIPGFHKGDFAGEVRAFGLDTRTHSVRDLAQFVGLVFQDFEAQLFCTRVDLEVAFGPENFRLDPKQISERVKECLEVVGLSGFERRVPSALSGGEKQRLAIAASMSWEPAALVWDEPTTDLDPVGKAQLFALARRLRAERPDRAMVMVEHETEQALAADRVVLMSGGKIAADGKPGGLLSDSQLLETNGVRPVQMAQLCERLGLPPCLEVGQALEHLSSHGYSFDHAEWTRLLEEEGPARERSTFAECAIEVRGLRYSYEPGGLHAGGCGKEALAGIDLRIARGEFAAIVGANGSGKTTLVQHLNGLLKPQEGTATVDGLDTRESGMRDIARRVGYVFQNPDHQIFAGQVSEEVAFGPRNLGVPEEEVGLRVADSLEAVGLSGSEGDDPFSMTKGERQRVAVASVLASRPEVLIFDEPTTGLDYLQTRSMMDLIRRLNEEGHTIIIVTHNMHVVAQYAHRMIAMREGRIEMDEPVRRGFGREGELSSCSLTPPPTSRLGNMIGLPQTSGSTFLSVEEAARCFRR
jgi:energy-coupling factor transport system ATP-binding protein